MPLAVALQAARSYKPRRGSEPAAAMCYTALMDTAKPPEQDDFDLYEPEDLEEAARLDAEADAAFGAGGYVPHARGASRDWWRRSPGAEGP